MKDGKRGPICGIIEPMNNKTNAKDFFLHIASTVLLYSGTIAILNILFRAINTAFPQIDQYYGYYEPSISLPVATLIIVFPLFLIIANIIRKGFEVEPEKKEYFVRKWLIYVNLFVAGGILAGNLITLLYYFLDGRELTTGFLLKVLSVLVVIGAIFGYYIDDLKSRVVGVRWTVWRLVAGVLVVGSIVVGFMVIGTPQSQRMERYDADKISDLESIQWQVVNYWQQKEALPTTLADLADPISSFYVPTDRQTGEPYGYEVTGPLSFKLCANFNTVSLGARSSAEYQDKLTYPAGPRGENWEHTSGAHCFDRTIDPDIYRPVSRQ